MLSDIYGVGPVNNRPSTNWLQHFVIIIFVFHEIGPPGRVGLVVAMCVCLSVCLFVCLMSPFHVIFLRGRTGAEVASSVDWCNLDLDLDLDLDLNLDLE